jgi:heme exporter protein B
VWRDAALVAGKDLRIELRAKVAVNQIVPFALVVLLLFAFALDPDRGFLERATPGLFWVAVLLSSVVLVQRSFAAEVADGGRDALRLTGLDPAGVFLGKAAGTFAVLCALEVVLLVGVGVLYGADLGGWPVLLVAMVVAYGLIVV